MRRILVPLDGGTFAEQALAAGVALAKQHKARLDLVLVHAPVPTFAPEEPMERVAAMHAAARVELARYVTELAKRTAREQGISAEGAVLDGEPAEELNRFATTQHVDLVVMCTHGRGAVSRFWLGSVADRLLRTFRGRILFLRPATAGAAVEVPFRTAFVALDGHRLAEAAIEPARELTAANGTVVLGRCVEPPVATPLAFEMPVLPPAVSLTELREAAGRYLQLREKELAGRGVTARHALGEATNPAEWIIERAKAEGATLIALSTHGRGGLERVMLGSVADKVIRAATVPVLVCHPAAPAL
jgi:nucleotide-binding universal stress UspA family protein